MHDAGEKDTPPSDRLVVARKPLLPTPYARFYSSTRFRSVSRFRAARPSELANSDLAAILVAPPLPAARFEANRSSLVSSDHDVGKRAPIRPSDRSSSSRALIDSSSAGRRASDYEIIRDLTRFFFWKDLIQNI